MYYRIFRSTQITFQIFQFYGENNSEFLRAERSRILFTRNLPKPVGLCEKYIITCWLFLRILQNPWFYFVKISESSVVCSEFSSMCRFMQYIFQIGGLCVVLYNTQYNTPESLVLWREYPRISGFMQTIHQNLRFY